MICRLLPPLTLLLAVCLACSDGAGRGDATPPLARTESPASPSPARATGLPSPVTPESGLEILQRIEAAEGESIDAFGPTAKGQVFIVRDKQITVVDARAGTSRGIAEASYGAVFAMDASEGHVVWVETTAQDLFTFPWQLFAHDLRTGVTTMLAQAPDVGVTPVPAAPNGTAPRIHGGRVYYSAARRVVRGRVVPAVYSVPVDGSAEPRLEQAGRFSPEVSDDRLITVRADAGSFANWSIDSYRLPKLDGRNEIASGGPRSRMSGTVSRSGQTVWQEGQGARCRTRAAPSRDAEPRMLLAEASCSQGFAYYLRVDGARGAFARRANGAGYKAFLVDLRDGTITRFLQDDLVQSPLIGGRYVLWQPVVDPESGDPEVIYVGRLTGSGR